MLGHFIYFVYFQNQSLMLVESKIVTSIIGGELIVFFMTRSCISFSIKYLRQEELDCKIGLTVYRRRCLVKKYNIVLTCAQDKKLILIEKVKRIMFYIKKIPAKDIKRVLKFTPKEAGGGPNGPQQI